MTTTIKPVRTHTPDTRRGPYDDSRDYTYYFAAPGVADRPWTTDRELNAVRLRISHSKSYKRFEVDVKAVTIHASGSSESFGIGHDLRHGADVFTEPAARYSRKRLDALNAEALALFPECIPTDTEAYRVWQQIVAAHEATAAAS